MAKTKFLDYTGLAKLVEKIKNTYVRMMGDNEFNFIGKSGWKESSSIVFNYRKPDGSYVGTPITKYTFYNGQGKATGVGVYAESFNGKINGHTVEKNVPSDAKFTDNSVSQRTYDSHGIPDPYERPLLIGSCIIEDGTVDSTTGEAFVTPRITASINSGRITATGGFIGEATSAKKLSVDGGSVGINDVLVLGNYERSENSIGKFTPSGIVSKITDPDIENEIKKAIVWPTA